MGVVPQVFSFVTDDTKWGLSCCSKSNNLEEECVRNKSPNDDKGMTGDNE